jgi:hypothetical protein
MGITTHRWSNHLVRSCHVSTHQTEKISFVIYECGDDELYVGQLRCHTVLMMTLATTMLTIE